MTATNELRRMLDERGVEWRNPSPEYWVLLGMPEGDSSTIVGELSIEEATDGTLVIWNATPEQAVEATLGRGECHDKNGFDPELGFECTVCGAMVDTYMVTPMEMGHVRQFVWCPFCGSKVVN